MRFLVLALVALAACKSSHRPPRCYSAADCKSNQVCVVLPSTAQTCLDRCDEATEVTCANGKSCALVAAEDAQAAVCLPGGAVAIGDACTASVDCVVGAVCVARTTAPSATCEQLCVVGDANGPCVAPATCTAIDASVSTTRGTCIVP